MTLFLQSPSGLSWEMSPRNTVSTVVGFGCILTYVMLAGKAANLCRSLCAELQHSLSGPSFASSTSHSSWSRVGIVLFVIAAGPAQSLPCPFVKPFDCSKPIALLGLVPDIIGINLD